MTESRVFVLTLIGGPFFTVVGVLGLAALGVRGIGLTFGALIPLAIGAHLNARAVMRHGGDEDRRKR